MFGRNDFIENIKDALAAAGCDMGAFRSWQKQYDRLKKKQKEQKERYERCREQTKRVQEDAQLMEQMLIAEQTADRKEFGRLLKDLRQMQNNFDHEFLVSKEDQEFHSTYDTILRLGMKALNASDQKLLLQSEIENLLALLKENLEKEEPKIEEPKTLEVTDNKEVKPDIPVEDKKEEVKEETKTLFEKIWEFILKILDLLKVKK